MCVATVGVSVRMVRNLGMRKTTLFRPTLLDQYRIFPVDVKRTQMAIKMLGQNKLIKTKVASIKSTTRLLTGIYSSFQVNSDFQIYAN